MQSYHKEKVHNLNPVVQRKGDKKIINEDIIEEDATPKKNKLTRQHPQIHTGSTVMKIGPL